MASDNIINAAERTATVTVTGTNETGATVKLDGHAATVTGTTWSYNLDATAINTLGQGAHTLTAVSTDAAGNTSTATHSISIDTTAPTLISSSPLDNATAVAVGSNIVLTFNEALHAGTGDIVISNGTDTRTIAVGDAQVSTSGNTVTINPTDNLNPNTT